MADKPKEGPTGQEAQPLVPDSPEAVPAPTARPVPEWVGKTPLSKLPREVKDRILRRHNDRCAVCFRHFSPGFPPQFDHRPALINGGQNRESMIEAVCGECHRIRSDLDVKAKALTLRLRANFFGLNPPSKHPMPGGRRTPYARKYNRRTGRWETIRRNQ